MMSAGKPGTEAGFYNAVLRKAFGLESDIKHRHIILTEFCNVSHQSIYRCCMMSEVKLGGAGVGSIPLGYFDSFHNNEIESLLCCYKNNIRLPTCTDSTTAIIPRSPNHRSMLIPIPHPNTPTTSPIDVSSADPNPPRKSQAIPAP